MYDITEADSNEAKLNKSFSYSLEGKTLTTMKLSTGRVQSLGQTTSVFHQSYKQTAMPAISGKKQR